MGDGERATAAAAERGDKFNGGTIGEWWMLLVVVLLLLLLLGELAARDEGGGDAFKEGNLGTAVDAIVFERGL